MSAELFYFPIKVAPRFSHNRFLRLEDFEGKKPPGHPTIVLRHPNSGVAALQVTQVWMEKASRKMWVVKQLSKDQRGGIIVSVLPYGKQIGERRFFEKIFRKLMLIWDDAAVFPTPQTAEVIQISTKEPPR